MAEFWQFERARRTLLAANGAIDLDEARQIWAVMRARPRIGLVTCRCCGDAIHVTNCDSGLDSGRSTARALYAMGSVIETLRLGKPIEGGLFAQ
ncbi:MAG: hypothetical protein ACLP1Y_09345 [Candidatus Acidiferrales bacterium]